MSFDKTNKVFLIGESWLAHRRDPSRGNVQTALEDFGFKVENFAQNGVTLSNFWWTKHLSWERWQQIQKRDAMVIAIGFSQLSDADMVADDEAEMENVMLQALLQSDHVIAIVPNEPLRRYFDVRAAWYIEKQRDDLNEPDVVANAAKRTQLYTVRFQRLLGILKAIQDSHRALGILEMQLALTPEDICNDGCHLNHQGASKAAIAIAKVLVGEDYVSEVQIVQDEVRGKRFACMWKAVLAAFGLTVLWSLKQRTRSCVVSRATPAAPQQLLTGLVNSVWRCSFGFLGGRRA